MSSSVVRFLVLFLAGRCAETTSQINDDNVLLQNSLQAAKKHNLSYDVNAKPQNFLVEGGDGDDGAIQRQIESQLRQGLAHAVEQITVVTEHIIAENGRTFCSRLFKYVDESDVVLDLRCVNSYKPEAELVQKGDREIVDIDGFCYANAHKVHKNHQNNYQSGKEVPHDAHDETKDCLCQGNHACNAATSYYGCKWGQTKNQGVCVPSDDGEEKCKVCGGTWVGGTSATVVKAATRYEQVPCKEYYKYIAEQVEYKITVTHVAACCQTAAAKKGEASAGKLYYTGICSHSISGEANEDVKMKVTPLTEDGE